MKLTCGAGCPEGRGVVGSWLGSVNRRGGDDRLERKGDGGEVRATGSQQERRAWANWISTELIRARRASSGDAEQANPARASGIGQTTRAVKADWVGAG